jgi:hypothetical protein
LTDRKLIRGIEKKIVGPCEVPSHGKKNMVVVVEIYGRADCKGRFVFGAFGWNDGPEDFRSNRDEFRKIALTFPSDEP